MNVHQTAGIAPLPSQYSAPTLQPRRRGGAGSRLMLASRIELLQSMPVFGATREDTLQFLLAQVRTVAVPAGEYFFRENDAASSMFVLEAGRATVVKNWQGRGLVLHSLGAGDCFGEMALMDLCPRSASVLAEEDCRAIELTAADLLRLFERDAEQFALIQMNIGREVCRRLRATDDLLFRATMGETASGLDSVFLGA
jgi:CRP-like cAMP-binding protein